MCKCWGGILALHLGVLDLMYEKPQYGINKMFHNEEKCDKVELMMRKIIAVYVIYAIY